MKRMLLALVLAVLFAIPTGSALASQTAFLTLFVTVPASPLLAEVLPGCAFVVTGAEQSVECTAMILLGQPTLEERGWRFNLSVAGLYSESSTEVLPPGW